MNLRKKLIIILLAISASIIAVIIYLSNSILLNGFEQIEAEHSTKSIERFNEIIDEEFIKLLETSVGWSSWDDTYHFALGKPQSKNYIKNNFELITMLDSNFSRVTLFNENKKLLFSKDYDHLNKKIFETSESIVSNFKSVVLTELTTQNLNKPHQGIFFNKHNQAAEIYTVNPVLPGSGVGPVKGFMVFSRTINQNMLEKFNRIMKVPIMLNVLPNSSSYQQNGATKISKSLVTSVNLNYLDTSHKNIIHFSFDMPKRFFKHGKKTIQLYLVLIVGVMALLCLVFYVIFNKLIINRILILHNELNEIAGSGIKKKVSDLGTDELGILSLQVNKTLETIENNQLILNRSAKFSALGEVAASIAHEINNPITVISLQASSIQKNLDKNIFEKDDIQHRVQKIKNNVSRIEKIIKSLRFISRDGELDEFENVQIGVIIEEIDSLFKETLKHKGIEFDYHLLDLNYSLKCKPVQIAQVFINLISNSIDALENSPEKWIRMSSVIQNNKIIIKVADSGKNIKQEVAEKMMEPFFTTKPSGKGTGLGLSITKKILDSHGGSISLATQPHTEFSITL